MAQDQQEPQELEEQQDNDSMGNFIQGMFDFIDNLPDPMKDFDENAALMAAAQKVQSVADEMAEQMWQHQKEMEKRVKQIETGTAVVLDEVEQALDNLKSFFKEMERLGETGVLDAVDTMTHWVIDNGHGDTENNDGLAIIFAAAKKAVADKKNVPDLLSAMAKQLEELRQKPGYEQTTIYDLLRNYIGVSKAVVKPAQKQAHKAHKAAKNAGAIMTLGGRLGSFSQEKFWDVFTSKVISFLPAECLANALFDNGKLNMYSLNGQEPQPVDSINGAALMAICKAVFGTDMREYGDGDFTIALYLPAICKELGIDPRSATDSRRGKNAFKKMQREIAVSETGTALSLREQRAATMENLLKPFDPDVAKATDGSYYRLCVIEQYDAEKELLYVSSPFFFKLREIVSLQADHHSALTTLFHADVANERNWAAVELANRIISGIVRRGCTRPDSKTYTNKEKAPNLSKRTITKTAADGTKTTITEQYQEPQQMTMFPEKKEKVYTWTDSFKSLIDDCPQLLHELTKIEQHKDIGDDGKPYHRAQAYNAKLKQTFSAAYRIILEKTDAPQYYKGLRFEPTNAAGEILTPTKSTLRSYVVVRHNGKNPEYRE